MSTLDTDLIPKVLGDRQRGARDYEEEGEVIRARKQFGAMLRRIEGLETCLRALAPLRHAGHDGPLGSCTIEACRSIREALEES